MTFSLNLFQFIARNLCKSWLCRRFVWNAKKGNILSEIVRCHTIIFAQVDLSMLTIDLSSSTFPGWILYMQGELSVSSAGTRVTILPTKEGQTVSVFDWSKPLSGKVCIARRILEMGMLCPRSTWMDMDRKLQKDQLVQIQQVVKDDQQRCWATVINIWSADMMTNIDEEIDQVVSREWPAKIDQRSMSSSKEWWSKIKKYWPENNLQQ